MTIIATSLTKISEKYEFYYDVQNSKIINQNAESLTDFLSESFAQKPHIQWELFYEGNAIEFKDNEL